MLIDQHFHSGAPLDFLGHRALTALSAAEMALKYNSLLVPVYGIRQPDGLHFELIVEEPIAHTDAKTMTQTLNHSLAAQVRLHPEQWFLRVAQALEIREAGYKGRQLTSVAPLQRCGRDLPPEE